MYASHEVMLRVNNDNKVEFIFENINLGAEEHGNVVFKIKTKSTLAAGATVTNNANIYFDYNAPVSTNIASTTFQTLGVNENQIDSSVIVFPNPTSNSININANNTIKSIEMFDVQGRVLQTTLGEENHNILDVSAYSDGVYFIKITTEKGIKTERFVKK